MTTENVVYRIGSDDAVIEYHAVPSACTGAADSLTTARSRYRSELSGRLHVDRRGLPPVIEHVEALVHGIRVREQMGTVHRDHTGDRMFLQTLLAPGDAQDQLRAYLRAAHHDPVVVLAAVGDPVGSVLDQMTDRDTVVVAYPDTTRELGWAAIYGAEVQGVPELPRVSADDQLRTLTVGDLVDRYGLPGVQMGQRALPEAC
jgi:hypothetical protein